MTSRGKSGASKGLISRLRAKADGVFQSLPGVDHGGSRYMYEADPTFGPIHAAHRPDYWEKTTCGYCSVGCGMLLGVKEEPGRPRVVAVRGDPDHPVNQGRLCPKGLTEHLAITAPNRLQTPLWNGEPVFWDFALDRFVARVNEITDRYGKGSFAVISTGQLVTEEFYTLGKLVRLGMGLEHYDGNTTLCMASAVSGYKMAYGSDGPPSSYEDFTKADVIVLIGANIADNHPLLTPKILENRDATIITVDPRVTKTALISDHHLAIKPRSDIALLNGLIRFCIDKGAVDYDFVRDHTTGFADLLSNVVDFDFDLDTVATACGVDRIRLEEVALKVAGAERLMIAWTMGVNHSTQGSETSALITTLCTLRGMVGKPGTGPFSITGQCNAMGTRETGFTASMPGYRAYDNPTHRAELAALWDIDEARIPVARGHAYPDIINGIIDGKIKGLWVIGTNPVVSFPNRELLEHALDKLDFLVVQDGYETDTTTRAHLVLPAAAWGEKDGTYTNSERRVSRVRAVVAPPGQARSDFDIFLAIADRLGLRATLFNGWKTAEDAFTEWSRISAGRLCDYSGITYDRIETAGGVQWPCPADPSSRTGSGTPVTPLGGTPRLYADGRFNTPDGRARLVPVRPEGYADQPTARRPFVLNTGRTVEHWHTRTKTGQVEILERLAPRAWVEINEADADDLGVVSGSYVHMTSERGSIDRIEVRVTATVRAGEVFVPFHYGETCVNRLTLNDFDPISREPNYKQCAVSIDRLPKGS